MQTLYYTTYNFIRHTDNVVDLGEYRRRLERANNEADGWHENAEAGELQAYVPRPRRSAQRRERRWSLLDKWAAVGIIVMTVTFTIQTLCM